MDEQFSATFGFDGAAFVAANLPPKHVAPAPPTLGTVRRTCTECGQAETERPELGLSVNRRAEKTLKVAWRHWRCVPPPLLARIRTEENLFGFSFLSLPNQFRVRRALLRGRVEEAVLVTPPEPLQQGTTKTESILSHVSSVRKPIGTAASSPLLETPASNMGSPPGTGDAIPLEPAAIVLNLKRAASPAPSEMSDFEAPIDPMIFAKPVPVCGSVRLLAAATPMKRKRGRPPKKRPSPSKDNAAEDVVAAPSSDSPRQERVKRRRRNLVRDSDSGETGGEEVGSGVKEEMDGSESESLKVGGKRSRWLLKRSASQCAHSQESKRMRFSESELSEDEVSEEEASDLSTTDLDESEEEVKAVSPVAHRPKTRAKRAVNYAEDDYSSADAESMSYSSESNGPTTVHGSDSEDINPAANYGLKTTSSSEF